MLVVFVLGACSGSSSSDTTASTTAPTQQSTTSTSAAATTSTSGLGETTTTQPVTTTTVSDTTTTSTLLLPPRSQWLTVDAFAGIPFGTPIGEVAEALEPELGAATGEGGPACSGLEQLPYFDLALYFDEDRLVGWWYGGALRLETPSGVAPYATTAADLPGIYEDTGLHIVTDAGGEGSFIYVLPTSGGPSYLAGAVADGLIGTLFAGSTCLGPHPVYRQPADVALAFWDAYVGGEQLSLVATSDAITWIEENGERDKLPGSAEASLDTFISMREGGSPSGCWLYGDVTSACILTRPGAEPALEDIVLWIQDRSLPDPSTQTWLDAYLVVGADFASSVLFFD